MTAEPFSVSTEVDVRFEMPEGYSTGAIEQIVAGSLRHEHASGPWEISIVFADDNELRMLHRDYLHDDTPTDIMTFPFQTDGNWAGIGEIVHGGDIAISVERATEQRIDEGWDTLSELKFLVVHGVLHLLGWDDSTEVQQEAMHERQRAILSALM